MTWYDMQEADQMASNVVDTLRSLKEEIRSCKVHNDKIMQAQEKQTEVNAIIL